MHTFGILLLKAAAYIYLQSYAKNKTICFVDFSGEPFSTFLSVNF